MTKRGVAKVRRLGVFINGVAIGVLESDSTGALAFTYHQEWLESIDAFPISRRFLLRREPYVGKPVQDYFNNLLPEDRTVRERIAANTRAAGIQPFDLLAAVGRDCVGALQFYDEDKNPGPVRPVKGELISNSEIGKLVRSLQVNPLGMDPEKDFRISLAGAQSKTVILRFNEKWFLPLGSTPTTHILKPSIGPISGGPDLSFSVENEWLCLKIMRAFGIPAAVAEMANFSDTKVLVVERFDRKWVGTKLFRLPQEDLCQALGFGSQQKYEAEGGPGIREILSLLNESDTRDPDRRQFMKSQLVFWLIAAIDGHAKNFSLLIRPGGFVLAPIYDVLSAYPCVNPRTFPIKKIKMAMAVGDNRHYKVNEILRRHWVQMGRMAKFAEIEELISEVSSEAQNVIDWVARELPRKFPQNVSEPILNAIRNRARKLSG